MFVDVIIFVLVLSLLVGIHELGHFLAAKACGIYVDRFSIGMPPRLFGIKVGETDYCIGALPIGGYVKMAGQEDAPLTEEERQHDYGHVPPERWFNRKPVWQRCIVLVAGPAMNVVLAVVLYAILAAAGSEVPEWEVEARIGKVKDNSPAAEAPLHRFEEGKTWQEYQGPPEATGWQTGDIMVSIDGRPVSNFSDVAITAILGGPGTLHTLVLDRPGLDGATTRFLSQTAPEYFDEEKEYPQFGVSFYETALVGETIEGMPGASSGLQKGDIIVRANGKSIDRKTFISVVEEVPEGSSISLDVMRDDTVLALDIVPQTIGRIRNLSIGVAHGFAGNPDEAKPLVVQVTKDFQESTGIQRKDVITEISGHPATVKLFGELEKANPGATLQVKIERPSILFGLIQSAETLEASLPVEAVRAIGIGLTPRTLFHRIPPAQVMPEAFRQSYLALERTILTVKALITRDVSPQDLGGPVMIFDLTTKAAEAGLGWLMKISAFISVNLAVINLLPLPVLDGGQIVVNCIEAIRRKPLNTQILERFQQLGLLMIISLMLYVTWNDIGRWISDLTP